MHTGLDLFNNYNEVSNLIILIFCCKLKCMCFSLYERCETTSSTTNVVGAVLIFDESRRTKLWISYRSSCQRGGGVILVTVHEQWMEPGLLSPLVDNYADVP